MVTQSKRLYHVDHSTTCFFQVEDLFIPPVLVVVQLLDGMELLGDLLISLLQPLLYGLFVLSKIGIEPTKFCTIPKSLSLSLLLEPSKLLLMSTGGTNGALTSCS